ncbi:MAG: hypothetical protein GVY14_12970 [Spirochaetes bacterium]|jgi:hypothetical protein|nr:hypothetical protein [Spirochaetota bacterium]
MAEKPASDEDDTRTELEALLDKLDEESLQFLKQQAEILIYSSELEEARRKAVEAARNINRVQKQRRRASRTDAESEPPTGEAAPEESGASETEQAGRHEPPVSITRRSDTSFLISVTGTRVFFNRQEMREMTRIAHAASGAADGARRLHRWLARERSDFLKDTGAGGAGDPRLAELWSVIVSTYKAD